MFGKYPFFLLESDDDGPCLELGVVGKERARDGDERMKLERRWSRKALNACRAAQAGDG